MPCILDDVVEPALQYAPVEFVREAAQAWERDEAHALRRAVFCIEQGIFAGDDRDAIDAQAQLLVAMSCLGGMPDQVVGTVRIHEAAPGLWWGSRLAVHPSFRSQGHLGATLIRLAVSRAHAQGCETFLRMCSRRTWRSSTSCTGARSANWPSTDGRTPRCRRSWTSIRLATMP